MVIDVGYLKRVTKRILALAITLLRYISCFQNGSILHAIFDCVRNCINGRATYKIIC